MLNTEHPLGPGLYLVSDGFKCNLSKTDRGMVLEVISPPLPAWTALPVAAVPPLAPVTAPIPSPPAVLNGEPRKWRRSCWAEMVERDFLPVGTVYVHSSGLIGVQRYDSKTRRAYIECNGTKFYCPTTPVKLGRSAANGWAEWRQQNNGQSMQTVRSEYCRQCNVKDPVTR